MPSTSERTELSELLRELEQGSAAVLRNTVNVKGSLYGSVPEVNEKEPMHDTSTAVGVLKVALRNISKANDDLVFLRDSCNLNLKGVGGATSAEEQNRVSRY